MDEEIEGRVIALESGLNELRGDLAAMKKEVRENTEITTDIHKKNEEMYLAFTTAKNGIRMITKTGDAVMKVSDMVERRPKTSAIAIIGSLVGYNFATTGKVPEWFSTLMKALLA